MVNKDGATIGESLQNENVKMAYCTYSATNGLADTGIVDGINAAYVKSSSGQLKALYPPSKGGGSYNTEPTPWIYHTWRVDQNDKLSVTGNI